MTDATASIVRPQTNEEKQDFISISGDKSKNALDKFEERLAQEEQKAIKSKKPFASRVARDDFNDAIESQKKSSERKHGFIEWSEIKEPIIKWEKYSDIKNFELPEEGEEAEPANKHHPAKLVKYKKYKFKGYSNTYTVFE